MLPKIHNDKGGPQGAYSMLRYNTGKVDLGVASVVDMDGIYNSRGEATGSNVSIYNTFDRVINNPGMRNNNLHPLLHFSVNPVQGDGFDEETSLRYIRFYLKEMGLEGLPFVVFRHEDIDRAHYHVVAAKLDDKGRCCMRNSFTFPETLRITDRFVEQNGLPKKVELNLEPCQKVVGACHYIASAPQKTANFMWLYNRGLEFNYSSEQEFSDVMRSMGVAFRHSARDGSAGESVYVYGVESDGTRTSRSCGLEKPFHGQAYGLFLSRLGENTRKQPLDIVDDVVSVSALCDVLMNRSDSAETFRHLALELGIDVVFHRERPSEWKKGEQAWDLRRPEVGETLTPITGVSFIDRKRQRIVTPELLNGFFDCSAFNRAESEGRWDSVYRGVAPGRLATPEIAAEVNRETAVRGKRYNDTLLGYAADGGIKM